MKETEAIEIMKKTIFISFFFSPSANSIVAHFSDTKGVGAHAVTLIVPIEIESNTC